MRLWHSLFHVFQIIDDLRSQVGRRARTACHGDILRAFQLRRLDVLDRFDEQHARDALLAADLCQTLGIVGVCVSHHIKHIDVFVTQIGHRLLPDTRRVADLFADLRARETLLMRAKSLWTSKMDMVV